ncbi:MAG: hypothetical protein KAT71_01410, partial [Gammaproteobacteria bacterium]|nr:hypothetical protein [Gammaproteobacteria bacterium]
GSYALVQVSKVYPGTSRQLSKQQLQRLQRSIALNFGQGDYELLTHELMSKAKIVGVKTPAAAQ